MFIICVDVILHMVGVWVGLAVGLAVGTFVGLVVRLAVGLAVGTSWGWRCGVVLVDDGPAVGPAVGTDEAGAAVGVAVGLLPDGAVVGTTDPFSRAAVLLESSTPPQCRVVELTPIAS